MSLKMLEVAEIEETKFKIFFFFASQQEILYKLDKN